MRKPLNPFPLTVRDEVMPSDPKEERTRAEVNAHPEDLRMRILRTRRYFRLTHRSVQLKYARGLDSDPADFA
jgi:hypothetical protein